jgi:arylsulfatase
LLPLLEGHPWSRQQPIYWEHEGNAAARVGNFKLVRKFNEPWELYDMETDRTELHDLSKGNESRLKSMTAEYDAWTNAVGVVDWNILKPRLLKAWQMSSTEG